MGQIGAKTEKIRRFKALGVETEPLKKIGG